MNIKKTVAVLVFLSLISLFVLSCSENTNTPQTNTTTNNSVGNEESNNTVHMSATSFNQSTVTIQKGESLTIVNDTGSHNIQNGSWEDGTANANKEEGAPEAGLTFSGTGQQTIGPFATAGTYHLYCTFHSGMNLTIIVE